MERTLTSHTGMKMHRIGKMSQTQSWCACQHLQTHKHSSIPRVQGFFFVCFITNQWAREMLWMKVFAVKLADLSFEFDPQDLHGERRELLL